MNVNVCSVQTRHLFVLVQTNVLLSVHLGSGELIWELLKSVSCILAMITLHLTFCNGFQPGFSCCCYSSWIFKRQLGT
ncbi:uncharacterized protein [Aegilops tauschii subsp. strangulata]|uniref:uncharacterized protein isoform X2 n=1 Tax=Aegilops tauschii subsp. strangulata TaxID=200361 RepID=UPI003CC84972